MLQGILILYLLKIKNYKNKRHQKHRNVVAIERKVMTFSKRTAKMRENFLGKRRSNRINFDATRVYSNKSYPASARKQNYNKRKSLERNLCVETIKLVRSTGLEPVRLPTRPSNVRVCLFRHPRINVIYYTNKKEFCQLK